MAKKKTKIEQIRRLICANHGGFDNADNEAILTIWNQLDEPTKRRYAEQLKDSKNADSS